MASCCCSCGPSESTADAGRWAKLAVAGLVAAQSMVFGLAINIAPPSGTARLVLHSALAISAIIVFFLVGGPLCRRSLAAARNRRVVFDQLFLVGIFAAFGASLHCTLTGTGHVYYEIVAILLAIYTFGDLLTEQRRGRALGVLGRMGKEFSSCRAVTDQGLVTIPVTELSPGALIQVEPGEAVCVDGQIKEGVAFVRESALTGEPFPVVKRPGDKVWAGSYSLDGELKIAASGSERKLDRLLRHLEEARLRPARLQREVDRLAGWFLPTVVAVSVATFIGWTLAVGWEQGLFNALAVVLVACPCAMGIATPVALWSALERLARFGFVPRDADLVEKLSSVDSVVFDKTGTLAGEQMEIIDFITAPGVDRDGVRARVAAIELGSEHPIAQAFRSFGGTSELRASNLELLPGQGIRGLVDGLSIEIGNAGVLQDRHQRIRDELLRSSLARESMGGTHQVFVVEGGELVAVAILRESLRSGARQALGTLERMEVTCSVMTGDRSEAAAFHGLPNLLADLSPEEKKELVCAQQAEDRKVLFVGDGINDSSAMAEANAAVAIAGGADLAKESADAELAGSHLEAVPAGIAAAKQSIRAIRHNLIFAASYNTIGIALAAAGILHPVVAALLMLVSSFTVTWRALKSAEQPLQYVPRKPWRPSSTDLTLGAIAALALFLQGPVLAALGSFPPATTAGLTLLFAAAGLIMYAICNLRPVDLEGRGALLMFSLGGLAMLGGWWADAGWAPVIRDGVCLCNCFDSTTGFGLVGNFGWMDAAMVLASLPMLVLEERARRWACWLAGLVGMILGMQAGGALTGFLPSTNPQISFFAGYGAMLFGMAVGMFVACTLARRFLRK